MSARLALCLAVLSALPGIALADACPVPADLGPAPTRLVVVVPGTANGPKEWESFRAALEREPDSREIAWLVFDHGIGFTSLGSAADASSQLASCIDEKVKARSYAKVTLIGHSIGGMLARRAYLEAAGALAGDPAVHDSWAGKVDRILLFASVNKGVDLANIVLGRFAGWLVRTFPHPRFLMEDIWLGSDFIADVRIAWIRHFGYLQGALTDPVGRGIRVVQVWGTPRVVQFWGTKDSIISEDDNADLKAFSGEVVVRVSGATHGNLHRLEREFVEDPQARWALFRGHLLGDKPPARANGDRPPAASAGTAKPPVYAPRRVLFILRGIRDSANSEWVSDLRKRAAAHYGAENIYDPDYGYFSAAQFAMRPVRAKNVPRFRDLYAELLARNPLTEFDFIGHSNGTYILGQSLLSTPSMRFRHVVLAAPVLPTDFNWTRLFDRGQVKAVRYDAARWDAPVGILCQALRAIGFSDVGPSGVVLFGQGSISHPDLKRVGWYDDGHSAAITLDVENSIDNRKHLLQFAFAADDVGAGVKLESELGVMQHLSRATPYAVWIVIALAAWWTFRRRLWRGVSTKGIATLAGIVFSVYVVLDVI